MGDAGRRVLHCRTKHPWKDAKQSRSNRGQAGADHGNSDFYRCPEGSWNIVPGWIGCKTEGFERVKTDYRGDTDTVTQN
jgi:hypothetical protein